MAVGLVSADGFELRSAVNADAAIFSASNERVEGVLRVVVGGASFQGDGQRHLTNEIDVKDFPVDEAVVEMFQLVWNEGH